MTASRETARCSYGVLTCDEQDRLCDGHRADVGLPPWVRTLLAAVIDQADETDCNRDHEGEDGCDACAWDDVLRPVPNRLVAEVYREKEARRG